MFGPKDPKDDPTSLGNILLQAGIIEEKDLTKALKEIEKQIGTLLGEILVLQGTITKSQLEIALLKQNMIRGNGNEALAKACGHTKKQKTRIVSVAEEIVAFSTEVKNNKGTSNG